LKYRPEIDGLRALAVVPVILFHAGFKIFSGGFVGVDVFFVISGYLITTIIIEDIEKKQFNIINFYERRARRILPALSFVMLVCIPFAWMWMLPIQMKDFSESLIAVSLFASNMLFWRESGYFDAAAEDKPLLHTWSLAVEEQYYLLFPIFLILTWKFGKNRVFWMIVFMAAISLLLSEWGWRNKAIANFYLAPTRAWEIFSGSITAFIVHKRGVQHNNKLALLGLIAILFSIFAYDESTPFPSVYALIPVLGVMLVVLYADRETLAAKLLSTKAFVGIGLISYSAYLWHQPLFAFARIRLLDEVNHQTMFVLSLLSLFLAVLTWKYIEQPFRRGFNKIFDRTKIFLFSFASLVFFIILGTSGNLSDGYIDRTKFKDIKSFQKTQYERASGFNFCKSNAIDIEQVKGHVCKIGNKLSKPQGILWGDSYAGSALFGINEALKREGLSYIAILSDGCPPLPGISRVDKSFDCKYDRHQDFINWFKSQQDLKELIWIGRFRPITGQTRGNEFFLDNLELSQDAVLTKFTNVVNDLVDHQKKIVFVLEGPEFKVHIPDYMSKTTQFGIDVNRDITSVKILEQRNQIGITPNFLERINGMDYVDSFQIFCEKDVCNAVMENGSLLVVDSGHISHAASLVLANEIFKKLGR
jgi:peptidoglycan/LPS O-acetylase OafA/YrhL